MVWSKEEDKRNWSQHNTDVTTEVWAVRVWMHCKLLRSQTWNINNKVENWINSAEILTMWITEKVVSAQFQFSNVIL